MGVGVGVVCAPHMGRCSQSSEEGAPGAGDVGHCDWPGLSSAN